jgi:hypothetical protein
MKSVFCTLALIALTISAGAGTKIDDPESFVRNAYTKWAANQRYEVHEEDIYTARLAALVALDRKEANGEVPRGDDFDFWCNCQEGPIKNPRISAQNVDNSAGRRIVIAKFEIDDRKETIRLYFEKTEDGWKLDDVEALGADGWTLSLLLKYGGVYDR